MIMADKVSDTRHAPMSTGQRRLNKALTSLYRNCLELEAGTICFTDESFCHILYKFYALSLLKLDFREQTESIVTFQFHKFTPDLIISSLQNNSE